MATGSAGAEAHVAQLAAVLFRKAAEAQSYAAFAEPACVRLQPALVAALETEPTATGKKAPA